MIYETLEQLLNEFFVDIQEENVDFSLGDLFGACKYDYVCLVYAAQLLNMLTIRVQSCLGATFCHSKNSPLVLCRRASCLHVQSRVTSALKMYFSRPKYVHFRLVLLN